ncbi:MAG: response regulator [Candidatus Spechtbacterales bacterium]
MPSKVLLIEDDPFLSDIYRTKFENVGFVVDIAENGSTGIAKATEGKPTIILLDIVLPQMTGLEILERLKGNEATKNIPVLILSNLGADGDVKKGLEMGADDYLVKSQFTPSEVVAKVNEYLKKDT